MTSTTGELPPIPEAIAALLAEDTLKQLNVRLPEVIHQILGHIASESGTSVPKLVEAHLTRYAVDNAAAASDIALGAAIEADRHAELFGRVVELAGGQIPDVSA
ncbi:MAG TPA: hypothetical protein VIH90_04235 [Candidatus Saccharimonadales bacterium]